MGIDFGNLIRRSFEIAWSYKSLWIFGLFAGGSGSFNFDWTKKVDIQTADLGFIYDWFERLDLPTEMIPPELAILSGLFLWALALILLFFICYLIAQPAIIDAVNKITRGGTYQWGTSFSRGADMFWRFFGLTMVEVFIVLVVVAFVVVAAVVVSPLTLVLTIPIGLVAAFFLFHTLGLAEVAMVARNGTIADALIEGWNLTLRNMGNCFVMTLILIGLAIAFVIVVGILTLIFYLPVNLLVLGLTGNLLAILLLALFIGLPIAIVVGGYTGTFFNALYVQFYFRLVEPQPAVISTAA